MSPRRGSARRDQDRSSGGDRMGKAIRLVIVGGVAGGASAAARARRVNEDADIVLLERGPEISFANCGLPYHIGGEIRDRRRLLVQTPEGMRRRFRVDVRTRSEAVAIDRSRKEVKVRDLDHGRDHVLPYDKLILSPGAEPIRPPIPGVDLPQVHCLRSLQDMDAIMLRLAKDPARSAVVIGGGYIGLEMTEALVRRGLRVTLVEMAPQVMSSLDPEMAAPLHHHLTHQGVDLRLGRPVTAFALQDGRLRVSLGPQEEVEGHLAILSVGVRPEVMLARASGLEVGENGGVRVDDRMRTSDPDIFAVGDVVETPEFVSGRWGVVPLAGPANRQGRIAADNAMGRDSVYRGTQGTAICKVFDLAAGTTGLNEKALRRLGRPYEKVFLHPASHAGYYPGAFPLSLKLLFEPGSGRVLGAQAVGADGVDKRLDVLSVAVRSGLTVFDLEHLELCYAPPFGSAKDPVNYAGFIAANVLRGDVAQCHVADVLARRPEQGLLDVRTTGEAAAGTIPGSLNIPLDELRDRLGELDRGREWLVFCQVGMRGYLACRVLAQRGVACRNLSGGYTTYLAVTLPAAVPVASPGESQQDSGERP